ncbi:MAG: MOSC N-terminal beta barrel domain-containing protein [Cyanobacteria bacterium P01_C01_bin.89]
MESPRLARIDIFPVKALDGVSVDRVRISSTGTLAADREFGFVDKKGYWINGKRNSAIHRLRSTFDIEQRQVTLSIQGHGDRAVFSLDRERDRLITWVGRYLQQPVKLRQCKESSFSDDLRASGPTIISTATLEAVARWYPDLSVDELRRRFRTNLEIDGVPAFWEDRLYDTPGSLKPFTVGAVPFLGCYPCQRCIVPTRNSLTGESDRQFQKTLSAQRKKTLPTWANRDQFKHYYRLAVNTKIPEPTGDLWLSVGDTLTFPTDTTDSAS